MYQCSLCSPATGTCGKPLNQWGLAESTLQRAPPIQWAYSSCDGLCRAIAFQLINNRTGMNLKVVLHLQLTKVKGGNTSGALQILSSYRKQNAETEKGKGEGDVPPKPELEAVGVIFALVVVVLCYNNILIIITCSLGARSSSLCFSQIAWTSSHNTPFASSFPPLI